MCLLVGCSVAKADLPFSSCSTSLSYLVKGRVGVGVGVRLGLRLGLGLGLELGLGLGLD